MTRRPMNRPTSLPFVTGYYRYLNQLGSGRRLDERKDARLRRIAHSRPPRSCGSSRTPYLRHPRPVQGGSSSQLRSDGCPSWSASMPKQWRNSCRLTDVADRSTVASRYQVAGGGVQPSAGRVGRNELRDRRTDEEASAGSKTAVGTYWSA